MERILKAPILLFLLYLFIWFLSVVSGQYYDYSKTYYMYMGSALIIFVLSYLSVFYVTTKAPRILERNYINVVQAINMYHLLFILGILVNLINYLYMVGEAAFTFDGMMIYRSKLTISLEKPLLRFAFIFNPFFMSLLPIMVLFKDSLSKTDKFLLPFYFVVYIYLTGSRSQLFVSGLLTIFFYFLHKKQNTFFKAAIPVIILFFSLSIFFIIIGKNFGQSYASLSTLMDYLVAPSHALDVLLTNPQVKGLLILTPEVDGFNNLFLTFRPIHPLLVKLGLISYPAEVFPYIETPILTNVYTMFGVYTKDYGMYKSLILVSFIGMCSGYIEKIYSINPNNSYLKFLVSLNFTCIILSSFYDYYLSAGCIWLMILFTYFLFPKCNIESSNKLGLFEKHKKKDNESLPIPFEKSQT